MFAVHDVLEVLQVTLADYVTEDVGADLFDRPIHDLPMDSMDLLEILYIVGERLDVSPELEDLVDIGTLRDLAFVVVQAQ